MNKDNQGQVLLITLLILAVGLTAGLAIVSRSVTDIRISQQEEESARALSMAEAGIEKVLVGGPLSDTSAGVGYTVSQEFLGNSNQFDFGGGKFAAGDTQTAWLVGHTGEELNPSVKYQANQIEVYWGNKDTAADNDHTPALEVIFIYDNNGFKIARYALDPNVGRAGQNKFDSDITSVGDNLGQFEKILALSTPPAITYAVRLKLLYNDTPHILGIKGVGGATIPEQGSCYTSTATVQKSGITRSVRQCNFYKAPPEIFDYVLFSGSNLSK